MSQQSIYIKYKDSVHLENSEMENIASTLSGYQTELRRVIEKGTYDAPESFLCLPSDYELLVYSQKLAEELSGKDLKYVIVVGIGGSNLGAYAVYEALFPKYDLGNNRRPKLLFADTTNPKDVEVLKLLIEENIHESKEIVLNIITKSGTTVETLANAMYLFDVLSQKFGEQEALTRTVVTTDEGSVLWNVAREKKIRVLPIPQPVGGRYSLFSSVGIFPLQLVGIDVMKLREGAVFMREQCLETSLEKNSALLSSVIDFLLHKKKLSIYNNFFFRSELESVGKWGRQLFAESLGKKFDKNGNTVNAGMTPIVSIGSTDLHSMVQLYLGGPRDKFTNFIYSEYHDERTVIVPKYSLFGSIVPDIVGKDFSKILSSNCIGTMEAYKEMGFPYIETIFPIIDEYTLGQYFMLKMMETIYLGKLWNINAFDQPEVESYKKVAREHLKS